MIKCSYSKPSEKHVSLGCENKKKAAQRLFFLLITAIALCAILGSLDDYQTLSHPAYLDTIAAVTFLLLIICAFKDKIKSLIFVQKKPKKKVLFKNSSSSGVQVRKKPRRKPPLRIHRSAHNKIPNDKVLSPLDSITLPPVSFSLSLFAPQQIHIFENVPHTCEIVAESSDKLDKFISALRKQYPRFLFLKKNDKESYKCWLTDYRVRENNQSLAHIICSYGVPAECVVLSSLPHVDIILNNEDEGEVIAQSQAELDIWIDSLKTNIKSKYRNINLCSRINDNEHNKAKIHLLRYRPFKFKEVHEEEVTRSLKQILVFCGVDEASISQSSSFTECGLSPSLDVHELQKLRQTSLEMITPIDRSVTIGVNVTYPYECEVSARDQNQLAHWMTAISARDKAGMLAPYYHYESDNKIWVQFRDSNTKGNVIDELLSCGISHLSIREISYTSYDSVKKALSSSLAPQQIRIFPFVDCTCEIIAKTPEKLDILIAAFKEYYENLSFKKNDEETHKCWVTFFPKKNELSLIPLLRAYGIPEQCFVLSPLPPVNIVIQNNDEGEVTAKSYTELHIWIGSMREKVGSSVEKIFLTCNHCSISNKAKIKIYPSTAYMHITKTLKQILLSQGIPAESLTEA